MHQSDPDLVNACIRGEQSAWNALVDRYGRLVYSVPRRYGLSNADADDVFQCVFTNLYRTLHKLNDVSRLSAWLITAAHRESWRVGKRSSQYADLDSYMPDVSSPADDKLDQWERQHLVQQALIRLGGRCETLLRALFMSAESPSYTTIATELGIPVGSIGPTRARCFRKMQDVLRSLNDGNDL
ncbi:MAG: sigma-70 family RNA polymerase sigma factor [Phycisphaerae bacterium]